jgi:glucose-6-phosphate 1-dehydrogenase
VAASKSRTKSRKAPSKKNGASGNAGAAPETGDIDAKVTRRRRTEDDEKPKGAPFAQDVTEKLPDPTTMVIFGATGDLSHRKLLPAVYNLGVSGQLPERFRLVGLGRAANRETFHDKVKDSLKRFSRTGLDPDAWEQLDRDLDFVVGDFNDPEMFKDLRKELEEGDKRLGTKTRKLFYLATAPQFFGKIATGLAEVGLGKDADPDTSIIIEKPFGHDLPSALELNEVIQSAFYEHQIYRIDHYLGKETVQNLIVWRFANGIFEPTWNRRYIDHVQITVAEDLGVGERGGYYDTSGALRDIVQNHMMQLVALIGMEPPAAFEADLIRDEKVKLLRAIKVYPREKVGEFAVRGQYRAGWVGGEQVPGYREESDNIPDDSRTETYVAMRLEIDNWRWAGTPFYVRTGKRLPRRSTEIAIRYRPVPHLPFSGPDTGEVAPNELVLSVQPNEGATLTIEAKVPGTTMSLRPVQMDFRYGGTFASESPEAYERLIHDAMVGEATLFTRADEVETAWRLVDPVLAAWEADEVPLEPYDAGSQGPVAAQNLMRPGETWRPL